MLKHLSLAVRLKDGVTGAALKKNMAVRFLLDGFAFTPVRKTDGWFAFVNIDPGVHTLQAVTAWFLPELLQFTVPDWKIPGPEVCIALRASSSYPFATMGKRLDCLLNTRDGEPIQTDLIFIFEREPIRLSQDVVKPSDSSVKLFVPHKSMITEIPGLFFLEDGKRSELCTLLEECDNLFRLATPLSFQHKRGVPFWIARLFHSEEDGHFTAAYSQKEEPRIYVAVDGGFQLVNLPAKYEGEVKLTLK